MHTPFQVCSNYRREAKNLEERKMTIENNIVTCNLVATLGTIEKFFPGASQRLRHPELGIISADFQVDTSRCKSKFGAWLAKNISTTRHDDDGSWLSIQLNRTEADFHLAELAKELTALSVRNEAQFGEAVARLESKLDYLKRLVAMHGEAFFERRVIRYEWPVLGSRAAEHIDDPAAYFDLCARRIRALNPRRVRAMATGAEPPESFGVCC
jgi:hypothetical protein